MPIARVAHRRTGITIHMRCADYYERAIRSLDSRLVYCQQALRWGSAVESELIAAVGGSRGP